LNDPTETIDVNRGGGALKCLGAALARLSPVADVVSCKIDPGMLAAGHLIVVLAAGSETRADLWSDPFSNFDATDEHRGRLEQVRELRDRLTDWTSIRIAEFFRGTSETVP
jgi:hypothetical protein